MATLHVVATPIGNLEDVTLRALRVLREADVVLAEDTRRTRILLDHHGIVARPRSLHAHNEAARTGEVLAALRGGRDVALVSDAGTPLVSDPGARVVEAALAEGHAVSPVPGPSAVLAALTVSGLGGGGFSFLGFLPRRGGERAALLARQRDAALSLVLFESPHRLAATLRALREALGDRRACVARELTKLHEEVARGTLSELAERFAGGARGEITIVVAGEAAAAAGASALDASGAAPEGAPGARQAELDEQIRTLLAGGATSREIAARLAKVAGLPKRDVYARCLALRRGA